MADLRLVGRAKSFFGYAFAGIAFVFVSGLILTLLAMAFDVSGEGGLASITALTSAFVNLEPLGIIIGFIAFLILGFLIWIFGIIGVAVRKAIGVKDQTKVSFDKRPAILAFFLAGIIAVVVFAGLSAILQGIVQDDTVDLTNIGTLFDAVEQGNPLLFVGVVAGLSVLGFLVIKIASIEKTRLTDNAPESLQAGSSD
jgi:hypothetical protein